MNSFLSQRNVYVKIKNTRSEKFSPTAGVPQGSVVAPIFFLIDVSNIPETPAEISQFADDFALFYRSKSSQLIQSKLQASLNTLIKWCDMLKIKINPAKTKYMLFKNPSKRQTSLSLNINQTKQFEETKAIKFLGITMTPQLNWNEQCKDITSGANKRIFQLQRLSNLNVELTSAVQVLDPATISLCKRLLAKPIANGHINHEKSAKQSTENMFKETSMIQSSKIT